MSPARRDAAGSAYLVRPEAGTGPGVLVLHSWWGMTPFFKAYAERLADEGFVALVPDLSRGMRPDTAAEAELELAESSPDETAALLLSSVVALRSQTDDVDGPIAVVGFSMGASWAYWLATRQPESVRAVVAYYGTQDMDFSDMRAEILGHYAETDDFESDDAVAFLEAQLRLEGRDVEFVRYPGTVHWFAEEDRPDAFHADAAAEAFERTVAFLR